jgi:rhodanese-related sulfurtransferase
VSINENLKTKEQNVVTALKQGVLLLIVSAVLGLGVNLVSPNGIQMIGAYRDLSTGGGPIVPPAADPNDPPFIGIDVAQMEHATGKTLFVDARNKEEFDCGTIPGSINLAFEELPADSLQRYVDSVLNVPKDQPIVVFCSGEECDLSLHLGRNLKRFDYTNLMIFFGGAREWEKFGLEMERRKQCAK